MHTHLAEMAVISSTFTISPGSLSGAATPDTIFTIANGLGVGNDPNPNR